MSGHRPRDELNRQHEQEHQEEDDERHGGKDPPELAIVPKKGDSIMIRI